jgi:hypothetical protein
MKQFSDFMHKGTVGVLTILPRFFTAYVQISIIEQ